MITNFFLTVGETESGPDGAMFHMLSNPLKGVTFAIPPFQIRRFQGKRKGKKELAEKNSTMCVAMFIIKCTFDRIFHLLARLFEGKNRVARLKYIEVRVPGMTGPLDYEELGGRGT